MNYDETIEWLYAQLPMYSRIGAAAYKEDLHNTIALCRFIQHPQDTFKSIHIAGTNGKGSTSHMLAAIFQEAGYKTGLYTSPHISDFRERIRINGEMISQSFVTGFVDKMQQACLDIQPSFFELTVAMAFDYFASEKVDIAIIETGLGGRLDSTNIITPVLSVITNIGYDHMQILGYTLPAIASEKAGIIKQGIPVVIGETTAETLPVFNKKAAEMHAPILLASDHADIVHVSSNGMYLNCSVRQKLNGELFQYQLDLSGLYQSANLMTVLTACHVLNNMDFRLPDNVITSALTKVKELTGLRGRWDVIGQRPAVILDVAHNEDGIRQVLAQLETDYRGASYHFILGFVNDKDISRVLSMFNTESRFYFTQAQIPRALPREELKKKAESFSLEGESYADVNEALYAAKSKASADDVIIICGSFFIIAELTAY